MQHIEANTVSSKFSKTDLTIPSKCHVNDILFALQPSQQIIARLNKTAQISGNPNCVITSFIPNESENKLIITGKCIDKLLKSAHIYLNSHLVTESDYKTVMELLKTKSDIPEKYKGIDWKNRAVGVCHAQEIHLLAGTFINKKSEVLSTVLPDETTITEDTPTLLLLSNPILDLSKLDFQNNEKYPDLITSMCRNLFNAAMSEGRDYIVMPEANLGRHKAKMFFGALMAVAKEYPNLNIIYHAKHKKIFDEILNSAFNENDFKNGTKTINVTRTNKNIILEAASLMSENKLCALHYPVSSNVIFGLSDISEHGQSPGHSLLRKNRNKTFQTFIGTVSTAILGSYSINPTAFSKIVERDLSYALGTSENPDVLLLSESNSIRPNIKPPAAIDSIPLPDNKDVQSVERDLSHTLGTSENPDVLLLSESNSICPNIKPPAAIDSIPLPDNKDVQSVERDLSHTLGTSENPDVLLLSESNSICPNIEPPAAIDSIPLPDNKDVQFSNEKFKAKRKFSFRDSIFLPLPEPKVNKETTKTSEEMNTSLSEVQLKEIHKTIEQLTKEIQSCWPYPNKDLKQIKINALNYLITSAQTMTITEAITSVKNNYPRAVEGRFSTRTADLLHRLDNTIRLTI
ncbi:hypothetical protein [Legionella sp.]|uniref:hypothetical protein n=1 Tax=Legionella sp. TaxID=459 RepID=UPI003CB23617